MGESTGDRAVDRLADILGAEIIATGPADTPLPFTGYCSRCGSSIIRYGPAGRPVCDQCRADPKRPREPGHELAGLPRTCPQDSRSGNQWYDSGVADHRDPWSASERTRTSPRS